jgi:hypothetical protein
MYKKVLELGLIGGAIFGRKNKGHFEKWPLFFTFFYEPLKNLVEKDIVTNK